MLGKTAKVYEYVRRSLGVPMHGEENMLEFKTETDGASPLKRETIGGYVSVIFESIRNGDVSNKASTT